MKIDLGTVQINQLSGDPNQLWTMPTFAGYPQIDLGGAVMTTPLPGRPFSQPLSPTAPPMPAPYPTTGAATAPMSMPTATSAASTPTTYQAAPAYYAAAAISRERPTGERDARCLYETASILGRLFLFRCDDARARP